MGHSSIRKSISGSKISSALEALERSQLAVDLELD